jgi:hypothetical protein
MHGRRISRSVCLAAVIVLAGLAPPVNAERPTRAAPMPPRTVHGGSVGMHHMALPQRLVGPASFGSTGGICHGLIVP